MEFDTERIADVLTEARKRPALVAASIEQAERLVADADAPVQINIPTNAIGREHQERVVALVRTALAKSVIVQFDEYSFVETMAERQARVARYLGESRKSARP